MGLGFGRGLKQTNIVGLDVRYHALTKLLVL
jgi:hypothetical protein